jgi:hypothetical protein
VYYRLFVNRTCRSTPTPPSRKALLHCQEKRHSDGFTINSGTKWRRVSIMLLQQLGCAGATTTTTTDGLPEFGLLDGHADRTSWRESGTVSLRLAVGIPLETID